MKDDILSNLNYDLETGYGSANSLYKQAVKKDPSITQEYIRDWI